ncbi:MAG: Ig-like domain-containing protein, partial [Clostridia bacterium]|nr:Ig-like domain-containing protein [Clostridia bacterium]
MKTKNKILIGLSALTLGCAVSAITLSNAEVKAVKADASSFAMVKGASVRLTTENYGLRFSAEIGESYTASENVSYNMMIIPANWIAKYSLSGDGFDGNYMTSLQAKLQAEAESGNGLGDDGKTVRPIATVECEPYYNTVADENFKANTWYISGSITSIKYANINGDFFGVAYTLDDKGTDETTDDVYTYATFVEGENVRDVVYVASASYMANEFEDGTDEKNILSELVTQGLNKATGVAEENKNNAYTLNLSFESTKYVVKGAQYQFAVTGMPENVDLKEAWSSSDPGVATIDKNGLLTAGTTAGTTTVTYKVLDKELTCLVTVGEKQVETKALGDFVLNSATVSEVDFEQEVEGEVTGVTIGETALEATAYSYADGKLTIPYETIKAYYGENVTVKATTADKDYIWTANIITLSISEASQFIPDTTTKMNALQTLGGMSADKEDTENYNIYRGYFVLANDIDFEGVTISNNATSQTGNKGLTGVFDGRNHTVSNFTLDVYSSFFKDVATTSTVKNVNFENVTQGNMGAGICGYQFGGTYENISVSMNLNSVAFGWVLGNYANGDLNLIDCTFVVKANETVLENASGIIIPGQTYTKLIKLSNVTVLTNHTAAPFGAVTNETVGTTCEAWENVTVVLTTWGNDTAKVGQDYTVEIANVTKVVWDGKDITSECTVSATGVTVPAAKITAGLHEIEVIGDTAAFLTVTAEYVVEEKTETFDFSHYETTGTVSGNYTQNATYTAKDFVYAIDGELTAATIGGVDASAYVSDGKFTIPADSSAQYYGEQTIVISTSKYKYTLNVTFATLVITDAYQMLACNITSSTGPSLMMLTGAYDSDAKKYTGYYVLGNDIDFNNAQPKVAVGSAVTSGLYGTFDGKNYTISGLNIDGGCTLFSGVLVGSTIKNVHFEGTVNGNNSSGIFGFGVQGTYENVTMDIALNGSAATSVMGYYTAGAMSMKDCTFVIKADDAAQHELRGVLVNAGTNAAKSMSFTNVTVITNYQSKVLIRDVSSSNVETYGNVSIIEATWGTDSAKVGQDYAVEIANVTKVVWDGKDITSECTVSDTGVTVPAAKITAGLHEIEVIGDTAAFLTVTAEYVVEEKTETFDFSHYETTGTINASGVVENATYTDQDF